MRSLSFVDDSWQDYVTLGTNKKLIKKTNEIIKEMLRSDDPSQGIGQPEPLKQEYSGCYARHLSKKDRLIYRFDDEKFEIISIGGHYDDH
jgi:toxin YoeB